MSGLVNELDLAAQLAPPPVRDDFGVPFAVSHAHFINCDAQAVADWRARRAPLGMTPAQYREFSSTLFDAADADHIAIIDARLKGSAAIIYSGRHKTLPSTWPEYLTAYCRTHSCRLTSKGKNDLRVLFDHFWSMQPWPHRPPFDSMFKLKLAADPSDYDIQLSSDEIQQRCMKERLKSPDGGWEISHPTYGFFDETLVNLVIPNILRWASTWAIVLGRHVAVKAFAGGGPPNQTATIGELSSHFRTADWMIRRPQSGRD